MISSYRMNITKYVGHEIWLLDIFIFQKNFFLLRTKYFYSIMDFFIWLISLFLRNDELLLSYTFQNQLSIGSHLVYEYIINKMSPMKNNIRLSVWWRRSFIQNIPHWQFRITTWYNDYIWYNEIIEYLVRERMYCIVK